MTKDNNNMMMMIINESSVCSIVQQVLTTTLHLLLRLQPITSFLHSFHCLFGHQADIISFFFVEFCYPHNPLEPRTSGLHASNICPIPSFFAWWFYLCITKCSQWYNCQSYSAKSAAASPCIQLVSVKEVNLSTNDFTKRRQALTCWQHF